MANESSELDPDDKLHEKFVESVVDAWQKDLSKPDAWQKKELPNTFEICKFYLRNSMMISLALLGFFLYQLGKQCTNEEKYSPAEQEQMDQNYEDFMRGQKGR